MVVTLPSCPACKLTMQIRANRSNQGLFFGCSNYPECVETLPMTIDSRRVTNAPAVPETIPLSDDEMDEPPEEL